MLSQGLFLLCKLTIEAIDFVRLVTRKLKELIDIVPEKDFWCEKYAAVIELLRQRCWRAVAKVEPMHDVIGVELRRRKRIE